MFFPSTDPVSVTGAWAWCGGSWLGCRELQAMRVVCLSGGWLWKWKPLDGPGTHYPQAIQLLNEIYFQLDLNPMTGQKFLVTRFQHYACRAIIAALLLWEGSLSMTNRRFPPCLGQALAWQMWLPYSKNNWNIYLKTDIFKKYGLIYTIYTTAIELWLYSSYYSKQWLCHI